MESNTLASQIARAVPKTLEPEYITIPQAQIVSNLGKSSLYNIINKRLVKSRVFSISRSGRGKRVRLISYKDLLRFLDTLPEDL
jgi:GTP-binding protein EngB required for normal cell division